MPSPRETPDSDVMFRGRIFRVERVHQRTSEGESLTREVVRHPGSVVILPFVDPDHVCLIRNYRVAIGDWLLELPAGTREIGEAPEVTARRELEEETGYQCDRLEPRLRFFPAPGILDEEMHLFIASGLHSGAPHRESGEEMENVVLRVEDAIRRARSGEIRDAKTILGLLLAGEHCNS